MEIIAKKLYYDGIISGFTFLLLIYYYGFYFSIESLDPVEIAFQIVSFVTILYNAYWFFRIPHILIIYKNNALIIYPNTKLEFSLKLSEITLASWKFLSGKGKPGGIILNTKDDGIVLSHVRKKKQVVEAINRLIEKQSLNQEFC